MTKLHFPLWKALAVMAAPAMLSGQAFVEYGLATAGSGIAGAPAQRANRSIGGVFSNLEKTLGAAKEMTAPAPAIPATAGAQAARQPAIPAPTGAQATAQPAIAAPAKPAAPAVVYEDPAGIREGMDRADLIRRFGEPAMRVTTGAGRESLTYAAKGRSVEVEMRDGKVASVQTKTKPAAQSAVVRL